MIQHRCRFCRRWECPNAPIEGYYTTQWVCDDCADTLAAIIRERKAATDDTDPAEEEEAEAALKGADND